MTDEPIYNQARRLSEAQLRMDMMTKEVFSAIAFQSAELRAANQALDKGHDIKKAAFADPVFWGFPTL